MIDRACVNSIMNLMNNTLYNWSDGEKNRLKMSFDPKATPVAVESPSAGSNCDALTDDDKSQCLKAMNCS